MYGNYKKRGKRYGRKRVSATRKAYLAGLRRGKAIARARKKKRWY